MGIPCKVAGVGLGVGGWGLGGWVGGVGLGWVVGGWVGLGWVVVGGWAGGWKIGVFLELVLGPDDVITVECGNFLGGWVVVGWVVGGSWGWWWVVVGGGEWMGGGGGGGVPRIGIGTPDDVITLEFGNSQKKSTGIWGPTQLLLLLIYIYICICICIYILHAGVIMTMCLISNTLRNTGPMCRYAACHTASIHTSFRSKIEPSQI